MWLGRRGESCLSRGLDMHHPAAQGSFRRGHWKRLLCMSIIVESGGQYGHLLIVRVDHGHSFIELNGSFSFRFLMSVKLSHRHSVATSRSHFFTSYKYVLGPAQNTPLH